MRRLLLLLALLVAAPLAAQPVLAPDFSSCIAEQAEARAPLAECIARAHAECLQYPPGNAAGTLCFAAAKNEWGQRIGERLAAMTAPLTETQATVLKIELRYSLKRNLTQCDRQMELAQLAQDLPEGALAYNRANCEATAVATSLVELILLGRAAAR